MRSWIGLTMLVATPALASSPAAWAAHDRAAALACTRAANLAQAMTSAPVLFSDLAGQTAMLVSGTYRQRFMHGARGTMLCLYDRRSKRAEVSEAKGWQAR